MRVLNIIQGTSLGGMEQAAFGLLKGLKARGHAAQVLSLTPLGPLSVRLAAEEIPCEGLAYQGRGGWRSLPALKSALARKEGDALIMTGHNLLAMLFLGRLCHGRRVLAMHFHHAGVKPRWQWRLIYRIALRKFQAITFPSAFIRDEAVRLYPPVAPACCVVPNPVPLREPLSGAEKIQAKARLGLGAETYVVGNAGWLIRRKRFDVFLQTAKEVLQKEPKAVFLIAGDGPERGPLKAMAHSLGIEQQLRWLGWQEDLGDFYRSLDVLLFNSDWDAMGMTPLEAMSFGVPVVASVLHGGLGEMVEHGHSGYLFTEHDGAQLADTVIELLRDPQERRRIGGAARERIARSADPDACVAAYEKLLGMQPS